MTAAPVPPPEGLRNTDRVVDLAGPSYARAIEAGLMQQSLRSRDGKRVVLADGKRVTEFISCSYLGLDLREDVVARGQALLSEWGVHLCCARSRFSIGPLTELEEKLSSLWGGRAITFPSVTTAHLSTMPLLATEAFGAGHSKTAFLFDRFAHASMQYLRPVLAAEHRVEMLPHNDVGALERAATLAQAKGEHVVYVADGVYSMGGRCPVDEVLELSRRLGFFLYLDDAHGTSIFGERGEGSVLSALKGKVPPNLAVAFSLSKGYGCNGGGVLLPTPEAEHQVRTFGQTYAFSAPLDFSVVGSALEVLRLHQDGTVAKLQKTLRERVALFDELTGRTEPFSPIRMVPVGDDARSIELGAALRERGWFVSASFFPIVPRGEAQLRICLTVDHSEADVRGLVEALRAVKALPS